MNNLLLQLQTTPARKLDDMARFEKELIKVGHYTHPTTGQEFGVTESTLNHWVTGFNAYLANGSKVPIPLGHLRDGDPEGNAGWVKEMFVRGDSLFGVLELIDPDLASTTDVSLCVEAEVVDSKGNIYESIITHVALCTHPVIVGLDGFKKLSLSLQTGETSMEFLKKLADKLGIKDKEPTEEAVLLAIEPKKAVDPLLKLVSTNRSLKLSNMVKAGILAPAAKTIIETKYVDVAALTLSKDETDDGFDLLCDVLLANRPVALDEVTKGQQKIELAKATDAAESNPMATCVEKMNKK